MIDYRSLLARYIRHVEECEGTTYVGSIENNANLYDSRTFTADEILELKNIIQEIEAL